MPESFAFFGQEFLGSYCLWVSKQGLPWSMEETIKVTEWHREQSDFTEHIVH